jgi:hypothetical protein
MSTDDERLRELTETGSSVRCTGRPIMTMIAEALGPDCTLPDPCHRQDCPHCYPELFMDDVD